MKKTLLFSLMAVLLAGFGFGGVSLADDLDCSQNAIDNSGVVACIGNVGYIGLQYAFDAATDENHIVVLQRDIAGDEISYYSQQIWLDGDTPSNEFVLDLNGYNINSSVKFAFNVVGKTLIVKDSNSGLGIIHSTQNQVINLSEGSSLELEGGTISTDGDYAVVVLDDSGINIKGGQLIAVGPAVSGNGSGCPGGSCVYGDTDMKISGGIVKSTADYAIYHPSTAKLTVSDESYLEGYAGAVIMNCGELEINGGTLKTLGYDMNGEIVSNGTAGHKASVIDVLSLYCATTTTISGGNFVSENGAPIIWTGENATYATDARSKGYTVVINGGIFSEKPDDSYIEEGYYAKDRGDGSYEVAQLQTITELTATITEPTAGVTPDDLTLTSGNPTAYSVEAFAWYDSGGEMELTDTFVAGETYTVRVHFTANAGYEINDPATFIINDTETTTAYDIYTQRGIDFTVPFPTGSITLPSFDAQNEGYADIDAANITITITNTGTVYPSGLTYECSNETDFEVTLNTAVGSLVGPGSWSNLFSVKPKTELAAGEHTATITLKYDANSDGEYETMIGSGEVSFTVNEIYEVTVTNGTATPTTGTSGTPVSITAADPGVGQVFSGWTVSAGDVTLADATATTTTFTMGTANVTVEATYKAATYTVTFDSDGGTAVESQTVTHEGTATEPDPAPTKEGNIFQGWFLNDDKYDFSTSVTASFTLTGKWEALSDSTGAVDAEDFTGVVLVPVEPALTASQETDIETAIASSNSTATMEGVVELVVYIDNNENGSIDSSDGDVALTGKVNFENARLVRIPVTTTGGVVVKVRHTGQSGFSYEGLSTSSTATCSAGSANPSYNGEPITPTSGYVEIYTCSASTFVAYTESPSGNNNGGNGGSNGVGGGSSSYSCKNLPANAVANNKTTPKKNTDYSYSTNTGAVCTFQCKSGYTWNEKDEKCEKSEETVADTDKQDTEKVESDATDTDNETSDASSEDLKKVLDDGYTVEFHNAYDFAFKNGITTMPSIDEAHMNSPLTRIAMAKMLSQYAINVLGKKPANVVVPNFPDVSPELDAEYNNGVTLAYQLGIMGINIENFRPDDLVTRAEFATALSRLLYNTSDGEGAYYETHLEKLMEEKIITVADPNMHELRGYVMIMLMRSAKNN